MDVLFLQAVLLANLCSSLAMTGLIWFVQIVHYPMFSRVGEREFAEYAKQHARLTSLVVGPLLLIETMSAVGLAFLSGERIAVWLGLGLVGVIWVSTAVIQIPCHTRLARGFDAGVHRRLVRSNWIRTIAWSARSGLALLSLLQEIN